VTLSLSVFFLLVIALTGSYRRVERVAIGLGLFELVFFVIAFVSKPDIHQIAAQALRPALGNPGYLYLVAANIGAVIMPWMIFYQQSAIADKRLQPSDFGYARADTAIGSVLTQLVMAAVLVATAATIGRRAPNTSLNSVGDITAALTPYLGSAMGRLLFSIGVLGAGLVASIVASLALAWGLGEVAGYRRSLEDHPLQAKWFYGVYAACLITGAVLVGLVPNLVVLNIGVEVMNALLLPLVLGFLILLGLKALPPEMRLKGWYAGLVISLSALTAGLGVYGGLSGAGLF
jgi:Mn2+/Fe2+ NRAMP family transporter